MFRPTRPACLPILYVYDHWHAHSGLLLTGALCAPAVLFRWASVTEFLALPTPTQEAN